MYLLLTVKGISGKPDHIIVDEDNIIFLIWKCKMRWTLTVPPNVNIVTLYNQEKESQERLLC